MSTEFLLTSLIVVLIPGTGVVYTVSSSIGGGQQQRVTVAASLLTALLLALRASRVYPAEALRYE